MTPRQQILIEQFHRTRRYTQMVLKHVDRDRWFEMPNNCPTHIAWQIGHVTWALALHALRTVGSQPNTDPVPETWAHHFGKGSTPTPNPAAYPSLDQLQTTFDATFDRVIQILTNLPDATLDEPATHPTGLVHHKLDLLYFVMRHESIHTGQICLIRRLLGETPYR